MYKILQYYSAEANISSNGLLVKQAVITAVHIHDLQSGIVNLLSPYMTKT